jgi:tetratricopeptide (TPR) repeat protein
MATKAKAKAKPTKKAVKRSSASGKSIRLKAKPAKFASRSGARSPAKSASSRHGKRPQKVESRRTSVAPAASTSRSTSPPRVRSKHFANAIQAYEAAIKLMHAEAFEKAIRGFENLIDEHPEEPEIQERAKVLVHACEKKIQEKGRTVLRSADDHYNVGIADLNRREVSGAIQHLEHALKLAPKADHILYALAAANAIQGERDRALGFLKQAIHHRAENRFLAVRDADFESLHEDSDFRQLVTPPEK